MISESSLLHNTISWTSSTCGEGFTVIVNVSAVPLQLNPLLLYVGVTVIVAVIIVLEEFVAEKLGIPPEPLSARPIAGLLFVHSYEVVPSVFDVVNIYVGVKSPSQATVFQDSKESTCALGLTVIVNNSGVPIQTTPLLSYVGVTVIVAVCEVLDVLTTPKAGIVPLPDPGNPIDVLSFIQL